MTAGPVFILAGEPSGDQIAAHLMRAVNVDFDNTDWFGVGGPLMRAEGLAPITGMDALTVVGFGNALLAYSRLSKLADQLVDEVIKRRARLVLTVDAKGFSLRFALRLRRRMAEQGWSAPIVHVVAPTVWAWGRWRAKKFAEAMDGLLCLFPFEPDYFKPYGLDAQFIGHPEAFVSTLELEGTIKSGREPKTVLLLPGSRLSEIELILPDMLDAVRLLQQKDMNLRFILPTVPHLKARIMNLVGDLEIDVRENKGDLRQIFCAANAMMAASGTITLQTALYGIPGVTCYRTGAISAAIGRLLVNFDNVILPNKLLGQQLYPFLFQGNVRGSALCDAVLEVLNDDKAVKDASSAAIDLRKMLTGKKTKFEDLVSPVLRKWLGKR